MKKIALLMFGVAAYVLFNAVFLYMLGFLLSLPFLPKGINDGAIVDTSSALFRNVFLVFLFGYFHSFMARKWFKDWWTQYVPAVAERTTYVVQASVFLAIALAFWSPMPAVIWQVDGFTAFVMYAVFGIGVVLVLWATFAIDHFELFGLRQVWTAARGGSMPVVTFKTPFLYRIVRHPMQLGVLLILFATPLMTVGHMLFAGLMSLYILIGLYFEERSLMREFGSSYAEYKARVPMLIPGLRVPARRMHEAQ